MPRALLIVFADSTESADKAEFDQWYEQTHVPEILAAVDRVVAGTRYRVTGIETLPELPKSTYRYATVYEVECDTEADLKQIADDLRQALTSGSLTMSPTLDLGSAMPIFMLPIGARQESDLVG